MAGFWTRALGAAALLCAGGIEAGSLYWGESTSGNFDHGRQLNLPANFGNSDFTLELWISPDNNFPVGSPTVNQLQNWSNEDLTPYSSSGWWFHGNFLLDGHNNAGSNFQNGTFSVQIYGSGRVRWLFGDGTSGGLPGNLWAVQSSSSPNVLDGNWHHVALVRRCTAASSPATLELWVDGAMRASETTTQCPNMATGFWNNWTGFPTDQRGWYWGAEKQAANGSAIWEDYKGLIDELRFWTTDRSISQLGAGRTTPVNGSEANLAAWFDFNEGSGSNTCRFGSTTECMSLNNPTANIWNGGEAPTTGASGDTTAPSIPQDLTATVQSPTSIMLMWSASTDNPGGSGVASYHIRRDGNSVGSSAGTTFTDIALTPNTAYSYTVAATDAASNQSGQSAAAQASTPADTAAPSVPANFAASATSSSNVSLTWTASTDNVAVTSYEVRRDGALIGSPTGTSFNDSGRTASTTYSYTILAVDAAGNTSATASASATTSAATSSSSSSGGGGGGGGRFDILTLFVALTLLCIQVQRRKRQTVLDRAA